MHFILGENASVLKHIEQSYDQRKGKINNERT